MIYIGVVSVAALVAMAWFAAVPSATEPAYQFVSAWGEKGTGPGQFHDPTGIAVYGSEVFVADSRNNRIQVFDFDGRFKRQFGKRGSAMGELGRPMNLTIAGNELYVPEYWNDRIQVFGLDGVPKRVIGRKGHGPAQFDGPGGVAVAPNGDLFVADFYNQRIQRLHAHGAFVRQWGTTGEKGRGAGTFIYPTDVALSPSGRLYVADGYANRIQAFDSSGQFVTKWGGPLAIGIPGGSNSWFRVVTSLAIGANGEVYAADFYNHRIQKFTEDGRFLTSFGGYGKGEGQFDHAIAVAVADDGTVFAADFANNRIEKWRPG
ncbi:MAG: NHL repeat-containing protein [Alphaproteobacteria bacterium]